jgi:hypothetical protein
MGWTFRHVAIGIAAGSLLVACGDDDVALPAANAAPTDGTGTLSTLAVTSPETASTSDAPIVTPPPTSPDETPWIPPSITSPTIPYTLPPDYGEVPTITRDITAPPRSTYPPDAILPPVEWTVDDTVTVQFTPPSNFRQDPRPSYAIQDYDRAHGFYVLERWLVPGDATMASFSVQTNPGEESPLLSRLEFSDSIVTDDLTWYLWNHETVEQTGKPPNMGMAVTTDYLYMVSGTLASMQAVIDGLTIER